MPNTEKELNLEQPNPSEQEEELALETPTEETPKEETTEVDPNSDPLDSIEDIDELRAEAKKHRSIAQRAKEKPPVVTPKEETPKEEPKEEEPKGDYLTKADYEKSNQKKAIRLATDISEDDSEDVAAVKQAMLDNWDDIIKHYSPRRGKDTPEDVYEDIKDAFAIVKSRIKKEEGTDTTDLVETKKAPTGNPPAPKKNKEKDPPNFRLPVEPKDWY